MYFRSLLLSLTAASALSRYCEDDPDFTWDFEWNGNTLTHHCSFLTNSNNPAQNEKRQNNWCDERVGRYNVLIKKKCPESCGTCDDDDDGEAGHSDDYEEDDDDYNDYDDFDDDDRQSDYCEDKPKYWKDSKGRGCNWYAQSKSGKGKGGKGSSISSRCKNSSSFKNKGKTAEDVCCTCGGGSDRRSYHSKKNHYLKINATKKVKDDAVVSDVTSEEVVVGEVPPSVVTKNKVEKVEVGGKYDDDDKYCRDKYTWWKDSYGRDCEYYEEKDKNCKYAYYYEEDGYTAEDVCCACGGGKSSKDKYSYDDDDDYYCVDKFKKWTDSYGNDCDYYKKKQYCHYAYYYEEDGYTAEDVCCVCGGGKSRYSKYDDDYHYKKKCSDKPKYFEDSEGNDCDWYEKKEKRCKDAKYYKNDDGYTAKDACCACGGGKTKYSDMITDITATA